MIETPILQVLKTFQEHGETYLSGGYIRDRLIGVTPKDVDLVTKIPFQKIKEIIPYLHVTENGEKVQVGRFQKGSHLYEITSFSGSLQELIAKKDFTINTFLHDGEKLIDLHNAEKDLKSKIIKPMQDFSEHTIEHPQAYLRAIRLASKINGVIDTSLLYTMREKKEIFYRNNENRIRQEGYEILHSSFPHVAWNILFELSFLKEGIKNIEKEVRFEPQDVSYILAFLSLYSSFESIVEFSNLFKFKQIYIEDAKHILQNEKSDFSSLSPKQLSMNIKWNRYKYQHQPEKLNEFFSRLKEHFNK